MLGAQWVMGRGDAVLARAASDLVAKIGAVIPEHLRPILLEPVASAPTAPDTVVADVIDMARVRTAIRAQGKLRLVYRDEQGALTTRIVWPIAVSYWERVRLIVAWCELRKAFRHFRTDRISSYEFLEARYATPRAKLRTQWQRENLTQWQREVREKRDKTGIT
jgi:predicted DNA-binding transcriptional regulator YafY